MKILSIVMYILIGVGITALSILASVVTAGVGLIVSLACFGFMVVMIVYAVLESYFDKPKKPK
jgi:hypothetical protein